MNFFVRSPRQHPHRQQSERVDGGMLAVSGNFALGPTLLTNNTDARWLDLQALPRLPSNVDFCLQRKKETKKFRSIDERISPNAGK